MVLSMKHWFDENVNTRGDLGRITARLRHRVIVISHCVHTVHYVTCLTSHFDGNVQPRFALRKKKKKNLYTRFFVFYTRNAENDCL